MASDQMLPNSSISSKKQQQLEAGKRRLEEFRKKKAAAKKAASANGDIQETKSGNHAGKSEKKTTDVVDKEAEEPHSTIISSFSKPSSSASLEQTYSSIDGKLDNNAPQTQEEVYDSYGVNRELQLPEEDIHNKSNHFTNTRLEDVLKNSSYNDQSANGPTSYTNSSSEVGKGVLEDRYSAVDNDDSKYSNNIFDNQTFMSAGLAGSESSSTSMSAGLAGSGRRSRPSFLDSINLSRNASTETLNNPFSSKIYPVSSSDTRNFTSSSVANNNNLFTHNQLADFDTSINYNSTKQNEDFAALEQHIEDLTQEKFSLQRALEASRVLAESLATENSALTDSYNQQGGVVNQLKLDMESLQEEIKALLVELDAVRTEYGNARLECNAADERAKLLASEVIGLEEKALRLRSNELKLERQLENLEAEMSSQKRRISSLEKERQDLQFTIDALQEEKKVLQSKLRKAPAPAPAPAVDIKKSQIPKKEASTSTDDLVDESEDTTSTTSNLAVLSTFGESDAQSRLLGTLEVSSSSVPPDQMRIIQNIHTLISELSLEKEELVQALLTESSQSSKLRELNKELSQKLEVQTQRLELLTSQSMVSDNSNIPARKPAPRTVVDNTPYADEGDEVVERVLGWIMKLFPGGPSRRQTKHL